MVPQMVTKIRITDLFHDAFLGPEVCLDLVQQPAVSHCKFGFRHCSQMGEAFQNLPMLARHLFDFEEDEFLIGCAHGISSKVAIDTVSQLQGDQQVSAHPQRSRCLEVI